MESRWRAAPGRDEPLERCFPMAEAYLRRGSAGTAPAWREARASHPPFPWSERHLQCLWYDPALRPAVLRSLRGEDVRVEFPGEWNLEAGPDFTGAVLRVGPDRRRIAGDVEIHIHGSGWKAHGHREHPAYRRVRVHVTYFKGPSIADQLPPGSVEIALRDTLAEDPGFSLESIDVTAYPYAMRSEDPPCRQALAHASPAVRRSVLAGAGQARLLGKAARIRETIRETGPEQALYEEVMEGLGYKQNKLPFRLLAARVGLAELRRQAGGDPLRGYAILLGVAGLLPIPEPSRAPEENRAFIRALWDAWWKLREHWEGRLLGPSLWQSGAQRPANRPERRLMAAARLFVRTPTLAEDLLALGATEPRAFNEAAIGLWTGVADAFWDHRFHFTGPAQARRHALIGRDRAAALHINATLPWLAAMGCAQPFLNGALAALPADQDNAVAKKTAFYLFGPDHPPSLHRDALRRQGLMQIFHDFCLADRSRCALCPFPAHLRRFAEIP